MIPTISLNDYARPGAELDATHDTTVTRYG